MPVVAKKLYVIAQENLLYFHTYLYTEFASSYSKISPTSTDLSQISLLKLSCTLNT